MAPISALVRIYDKKIEDGGQVIAVETVLLETTEKDMKKVKSMNYHKY